MNEHKRKVSFWVEPWMWQAFYRLFPNHGERSAFLREAVAKAIELGPQSSMAKRIMERMNKDEIID